jgi:hypothetical protein
MHVMAGSSDQHGKHLLRNTVQRGRTSLASQSDDARPPVSEHPTNKTQEPMLQDIWAFEGRKAMHAMRRIFMSAHEKFSNGS